MNMIKNKLIVVLYKTIPIESTTIKSIIENLLKSGSTLNSIYELTIWDNSPESQLDEINKIRNLLSFINIKYISTPENKSLSEIYNNVSLNIDKSEYLTLLDQDSNLPLSFFIELEEAQHQNYYLILPKVYCDNVLISPGSRFFARGKLFNNVPSGLIASKNLLAINSGMSIRGVVFSNFRYNEKLRFYGTDTDFMRNYEKTYPSVFILTSPINHSLAIMQTNSLDWLASHALEKIKIANIIFNNSIFEIIFVFFYKLILYFKYFHIKFNKLK